MNYRNRIEKNPKLEPPLPRRERMEVRGGNRYNESPSPLPSPLKGEGLRSIFIVLACLPVGRGDDPVM